MINELKQDVKKYIDEFFLYVQELYNNPEVGLKEYNSSKILVNILRKYGFTVEYPYILDTAFYASYKAKNKGRKVCFLCEYDALEGIGHGCGHNMIGVLSILSAVLLKNKIDNIGGEIHVVGAPAEENFGGKILLDKDDFYKKFDVCLMAHPSTDYKAGARTLAIIPVKYEFFGKSAHGAKPYEGKSALDSAVLTYTNINFLRQFLKPGSFIHGIIKDGGIQANVIPKYASLEYYFRAKDIKYANYIKLRAFNIANLVALANETELKESIYEAIYEDIKLNYTLCNEYKNTLEKLGVNVLDVDEEASGSSDVGRVSYQTPTLHGYFKICNNDILMHSCEFADSTVKEDAKNAMEITAVALASIGYKILTDDEFYNQVKDEFKKDVYYE